MQIRSVSINDVDAIVDIHLDAFKGFFLTSLGPAFLRFYYTCFVKSAETVTMVAEEDGVICGFAAATTKCKGFNSRLIKNNLLSLKKYGVEFEMMKLLSTGSATVNSIVFSVPGPQYIKSFQ